MIHESWKSFLRAEFEKSYFKVLSDYTQQERKDFTVYPPHEDVFNAFQTPVNEVKVVILGQDPYHGPGQAHGLCFSVRRGVTPPPSLRNIFIELRSDVGISPPKHGCLDSWARQGVFLLNTTLTVRAGFAGSHQGHGWEKFTDEVIRTLSRSQSPIAFILWGKHAKDKCHLIDWDRHTTIISSHPSPFSASGGFFGSKPFSKANDFLTKRGVQPVDWSIPDD